MILSPEQQYPAPPAVEESVRLTVNLDPERGAPGLGSHCDKRQAPISNIEKGNRLIFPRRGEAVVSAQSKRNWRLVVVMSEVVKGGFTLQQFEFCEDVRESRYLYWPEIARQSHILDSHSSVRSSEVQIFHIEPPLGRHRTQLQLFPLTNPVFANRALTRKVRFSRSYVNCCA